MSDTQRSVKIKARSYKREHGCNYSDALYVVQENLGPVSKSKIDWPSIFDSYTQTDGPSEAHHCTLVTDEPLDSIEATIRKSAPELTDITLSSVDGLSEMNARYSKGIGFFDQRRAVRERHISSGDRTEKMLDPIIVLFDADVLGQRSMISTIALMRTGRGAGVFCVAVLRSKTMEILSKNPDAMDQLLFNSMIMEPVKR